MRTAPAVAVFVTGRGPWRAWLVALAALAVAATVVWAVRRADGLGPWIAAATAALALHAVVRAWRRPSMMLRFDGIQWSLQPQGAAEPYRGDVMVAMDLGAWLLLRFRCVQGAGGRRRTTWLALRHADLAPQWHALRCALHSPRAAIELSAKSGPET